MSIIKFFLLFFLLVGVNIVFGQEDSTIVVQDSTSFVSLQALDTNSLNTEKRFIPKKAALYSAVIPGMGQVYNKKYWKVPLFYGAAGAFLFFAIQANQDYLEFRESFLAKTDMSATRIDPFENFSAESVRLNRNNARRNRDFMIILTALVYALQIVDASVDAHLKAFDVSDEISLKIVPQFETFTPQGRVVGVSLRFYIH